jgi:hypothetical protein
LGTIFYMQREPLEHAGRSNWLPTPNGPFRPILRMSAPGHEIPNGEYLLPAITQNDLSRFDVAVRDRRARRLAMARATPIAADWPPPTDASLAISAAAPAGWPPRRAGGRRPAADEMGTVVGLAFAATLNPTLLTATTLRLTLDPPKSE